MKGNISSWIQTIRKIWPDGKDETRVKKTVVKPSRLLTIFGWSNPFNTSISPHTFASLSLTFFFGMTFNATSFTMPLETLSGEGLWPFLLGEMEDFPFVWSTSAAAPRSDNVIWSIGTCHVARFTKETIMGRQTCPIRLGASLIEKNIPSPCQMYPFQVSAEHHRIFSC